jgi:SAM-dependent methyltransferase
MAKNNSGFCPLCDTSVDCWEKYSKRAGVKCPHCGSAGRHRLTALYLKSKNPVYKNFLHAAPEAELQSLFGSKSKKYICGDIAPKKYSKLNATYLDLTDISFECDFFDCIYASHILEHIVDDIKAMKEMYRVLVKGGKLLTMVPQKMSLATTYEDSRITEPEDRLKAFGQHDHVRQYGLDFPERLKSVGFFIEMYTCTELSDVDRVKFNIPANCILYICTKQ